MKYLKSYNESWRDWLLSAAISAAPLTGSAAVKPSMETTTKQKKQVTFPVIVQGEYTVKPGDCDALHAFQSRRKKVGDKWLVEPVGRMNEIVGEKLDELYKAGYAVKVTGVEVEVNDMTVKWKVKITESLDGKAWVGFTSRGAGCNFDVVNRAVSKDLGYDMKSLKDTIARRVNEPTIDIQKVGDIHYKHNQNGFRQVFYAYTKPVHAPAPNASQSTSKPLKDNIDSNGEYRVGQVYLTRNTNDGKTHTITIVDAYKNNDGKMLDVGARVDNDTGVFTFDVTQPGRFGHNTQTGNFIIIKRLK